MMEKAKLEESIARLEEEGLRQKLELEQEFIHLKNQLKPGNIIKGLVSKSVSRFKSMLPRFATTTSKR